MFDEVFMMLFGYLPPHEDAVLEDFSRLKLKGYEFPAVVPNITSCVEGVLFFELSEHNIECLDRFELNIYERRKLLVRTKAKQIVHADVYVLRDTLDSLLSQTRWDPNSFRQHHLKSYLENCQAWKNRPPTNVE